MKAVFSSVKVLCFALLIGFTLPIQAEGDVWQKIIIISQYDWSDTSPLTEADRQQLNELAEQGDANAQYALGKLAQTAHQHDKANAWFKRAALQGHLPARYSYYENSNTHDNLAGLESLY